MAMRAGLIEVAGALGALVLAAAIALVPAVGPIGAPLGLAVVVGWIMWRDARDFVIPDGAAVALAALAFAARLSADGYSIDAALSAAADGALCGGALWIVREAYFRLRGHDGLGFGDVKLAAAAGVLVGAYGFALALLAASLAGLGVAALRARRPGERLPLGALLAPAVLAVWAAGLAAFPGVFG
ncbi:prepilin peptidase [Hansschlegelia sp. KR7-227]|jgi:leader peptidase (prepilin peptidase)/N-methyltransferase|uniref:prepilin peptidase n=1 Tax=Hansschlegelia sp. KR7-227 TaxID=3400914 RepID=UPI003BFE56B2